MTDIKLQKAEQPAYKPSEFLTVLSYYLEWAAPHHSKLSAENKVLDIFGWSQTILWGVMLLKDWSSMSQNQLWDNNMPLQWAQ